MQDSVVKGILKYIQSQTEEFNYLLESWYDPEQGFTESLNRRLAQTNYDKKERAWTATMWNFGKPEMLSHRPKIFKAKGVNFVNNKGDLVPESEARDPVTKEMNPGYSATSEDFRYSVVQSVLNLDFLFNSQDWASDFQEIFTMRIYMSQAVYIPLPVLGQTCIYIDEVAMGDIDKFDRLSQGTLLSLPIDMVLTYPLIVPVKPLVKPRPFTKDRKTLITDIDTSTSFVKKLD